MLAELGSSARIACSLTDDARRTYKLYNCMCIIIISSIIISVIIYIYMFYT